MPRKKTGIIIQARMGSTRLPGKVMMKIKGKSVFGLTVERLKRVRYADKIILATSADPKNNALVEEAKKLGIDYFRGSEENVLDRFYQANKKFKFDAIVRITCDCPLIEPALIDKGIKIFRESQVDILSNTLKRTFPHGLDFEIFTADALKKAWTIEKKKYKDSFPDVFVNPTAYIKLSGKFKHKDILNKKDLSGIRITLDYPEDFQLIEKIYRELYSKDTRFGIKEILSLLNKRPSLLSINKKYVQAH